MGDWVGGSELGSVCVLQEGELGLSELGVGCALQLVRNEIISSFALADSILR